MPESCENCHWWRERIRGQPEALCVPCNDPVIPMMTIIMGWCVRHAPQSARADDWCGDYQDNRQDSGEIPAKWKLDGGLVTPPASAS